MKTKFYLKSWLARLFFLLCAVVLINACDDDDNEGIAGDTFAGDLDTPWEMEFAPDGNLFVTQRPGIVSIIDKDGAVQTWLRLDSVVEEIGESGLFGIELDPQYAENGYVYLVFTYATQVSPIRLANKIVRYKNNSGKPVFDKVLIDGIRGNHLHNVGALEFGPDGMLYCTVGETFAPELAQDMSSLNGKILRMTREGAVPGDNPFPGSLVYSLGHRNPQGLAFQPQTNMLWSTEHGPSEQQGCCMDEINLIKPGKNYGWPLIRGGQQQANLETPVYYSGDTVTWAPTGGIFITQGEWKDSFVFTGLRGQALYRAIISPNDPSKVESVQRFLYRDFGRLRNVVEGANGDLYIAVSNQDGRGDPLDVDDRIIKMSQNEIRKRESPY